MTRVNSAISVKCLTDEHLLAEHREIKRLPYCANRAKSSGSLKRIPKKFVLGTGHVLFFVDKMQFVINRYRELHNEANQRGFVITDYSENFTGVESKLMNDYLPTNEEKALLIERITTRIMNSPKKNWHYYGKPITKEEAVRLLKER